MIMTLGLPQNFPFSFSKIPDFHKLLLFPLLQSSKSLQWLPDQRRAWILRLGSVGEGPVLGQYDGLTLRCGEKSTK